MKPFRVIDTGVREGRSNIAFDQALIDLHQSGRAPDTIRFLRFPPTALIGRHQALSHEVQLDYCKENQIGIVRRITGGGAIYFDEGQLGWELVFDRATLGISSLADLAREICEAAAVGLGKLGVEAKYRPRNDIEVDGRKISGTGGFFDDNTLFYQGTVLVDMNPADMVAALKIPEAKLAKHDLESSAQRVVTLKELLGDKTPNLDQIKRALLEGFAERLGIDPQPGEITEIEEALAREYYEEEIGTDDFVAEIDDPSREADVLTGSHTGAGGTVTAYVTTERDRLQRVLITGDFFVTPPRVILDLESALKDIQVAEIGPAIEHFLENAEVGLLTVLPSDFTAAIEAALQSE